MADFFIVEDNAPTRRSLCERIASRGDHTVSVAVGTYREIRLALLRRAPDVLLVDLGLPDGNGIDIIDQASALYPQLPIMVITVFGDERQVVSAIRAGAAGYLLKDDTSHDLLASIDQLLAGGSPISAPIARHLVRSMKSEVRYSAKKSMDELTMRELEVLTLAAKGFSYAEIARMLDLSANTVGTYTKQIYEKLSVRSRAEAVYEASRLGFIGRV